MLKPGAMRSGLRISGAMRLGPREEMPATIGAVSFPIMVRL